MLWDPTPRIEDPLNFQSGGICIHTTAARAAWRRLHRESGVSSWALSWVHNKVCFEPRQGFDPEGMSVPNSALLRDPEAAAFVDRKVSEMLRVGRVLALHGAAVKARDCK